VRAVVLSDAPPALETAEVADPTPLGDEVVLRVDGCGVCGSDLHVAGVIGAPGLVMGHEIAGEVVDHGPDADAGRWPIGSRVVARPLVGCGECAGCRADRPDRCLQSQLVGLQRPGGFAEYVSVSGRELFAIPDTVDDAVRPLVEPLAIARHAMRLTPPEQGEPVLVLGAGPIGLAITLWARHLGAGEIVVSDPSEPRRRLAAELGASAAVDPTTEPLGAAFADRRQPPVAFECAGRPGLLNEAMSVADWEGRVNVVGICLSEDTFLPWTGISKELQIRFSIYYESRDFTDTIEALASGAIDPSAMITETVGLDALPERFARLSRDADGGKVVVRP